MAQNFTYTQCGDYYIPDIKLSYTSTQAAYMNSLKAQAEESVLRELVYEENIV